MFLNTKNSTKLPTILYFVIMLALVRAGFFGTGQRPFAFGLPIYSIKPGLYLRIFTAVITVGIIAFCLTPIPFADRIQGHLIVWSGIFLMLSHLLSPFYEIEAISFLQFIFLPLIAILAMIASFLSMNKKFENLFMSIGGGYVVSVLLYAFLGFSSAILYLVTLLIFIVVLVVLGKKLRKLHYCFCKSIILSFMILACVDFIPFFSTFDALFKRNSFLNMFSSGISWFIFIIAFIIIFAQQFFRRVIMG